MKIKIIDDDIQFIDSLKNNLTGEFDHVLINGSTSFDDEYDYDIYFLDIDMPNNGLEIARKIKQFNDDIIVIFVSFREDLIFEALQTFPYYFLRKKYLKEELPIVINKIKKMLVNNQIDIYYKGKEIYLDVSKILYIEKNGQYTQNSLPHEVLKLQVQNTREMPLRFDSMSPYFRLLSVFWHNPRPHL